MDRSRRCTARSGTARSGSSAGRSTRTTTGRSTSSTSPARTAEQTTHAILALPNRRRAPLSPVRVLFFLPDRQPRPYFTHEDDGEMKSVPKHWPSLSEELVLHVPRGERV